MTAAVEPGLAQCPACDTVFRVSAADEQWADGEVRCGRCMVLFWLVPPDQPAHTIATQGQAALEVAAERVEAPMLEDSSAEREPVLQTVPDLNFEQLEDTI